MKNKSVIIGLFVILLIGMISATPYILFVDPTPANGVETTGSSVTINSTIENLTTMQEFIFQWQGTNYSLYDEDLILMLNLNNNSNLGENDSLVYDSSRFGHNGSVLGNAEYISSGKYQGSYNFTEGQGINISANTDFNVDEFTISLWVKLRKTEVNDISIGGSHTCILLEDDKAYCWGENEYGQLGDGTTTNRGILLEVSEGNEFKKLGNADYPNLWHSCALLHNGSALCWGRNNYGQLGIGGGNTTEMYSPTYVYGDHNFSMVSLGQYHSCGLLYNGSALCWGENAQGTLGIGNSTDMYFPVYVTGGHNFSSISCGDSNTCGLLHNGSALCWGRNGEGQLGIGNTTQMYTPTYVSGEYEFKSLKNGNDFACGILHNGSALCWGQNTQGTLGIGNSTDMYTPTYVSGNYNLSYLEGHYHGNCGLLQNGSALCWGGNYESALGIGEGNTTNMKIPTYVSGGYNFTTIGSGYRYSCGISNESEIICWGKNSEGQQGVTSSTKRNIPYSLFGNHEFSELSSKQTNFCGIDTNNEMYCWGNNENGQIGDNTTEKKNVPTLVYGSYEFSTLSSGGTVSCGLLNNGSALCWGQNTGGRIGDNTETQRNVPTYVSGDYNFSIIAVGGSSSCGLLQNETAMCWGDNQFGTVGDGNNPTDSLIPTPVYGNYSYKKLVTGLMHTCGLLHNGSVMCWGSGFFGMMGDNETSQNNVPSLEISGFNFSDIYGGQRGNCGKLINGSFACWGYNADGETGNGTAGGKVLIPQIVLESYSLSSISIGNSFACGLQSNGSVICWGDNQYGQLGDGAYVDSLTPKNVYGNYNFSSISSSRNTACGITQEYNVFCWGDNSYGELGIGAISDLFNSASRGILFGKDSSTYGLYSTFGQGIQAYGDSLLAYKKLNSNWNNIIYSYDSTKGNMYVNGEFKDNFSNDAFIQDSLVDLSLGDNVSGEVDQIMMWNRTLTANEINQIYLSSLQQKNHTAWEFYSVQSLPSAGTYTYKLFAKDGTGWQGILRRIIKIVTGTEESSGGGGYISPTYTIKEEKLQEGHTRWLREKNKIKLEFAGQGSKTLEILSVKDDSVQVEINNVEAEVFNGTTEKIDVNSDGFYDLEVSLLEISETGSGHLMFKEIYEEISSESEEEVSEEQKEGSDSENFSDEGDIVDKKSKWWVYVIIGVLVILLLVFYFFFIKKK